MSHPDDDVLAALALGQEGVPADAAAHAVRCAACAGELAALHHTLSLVREAPAPLDEVAPPPAVWEAVRRTLEADTPGSGPQAAPTPATARPGRRWWWPAVAAAVGVAIGLAAGWVAWARPEPPPTVVASTELDTLDTRQPRGEAEVLSTAPGLALTVRTQPLEAGSGFLEVWLINRDLRRMVSIGVLEPGIGTATFPVEQRLLDQGYVIVDISRESFDDRPEHSGDSLVRGALPL